MLGLLSIIAATLLLVDASQINVAKNPIQLDLKKLGNGVNATMVSQNPTLRKGLQAGRTRPAFFQQVLGLVSGDTFKLNLDKWRALRESNLFSELSAASILKEDGLALNIEGYELPSITISPEVTIAADLDHPEVMGSVSIDELFLSHSCMFY